jgi:hypothetical protein
MEHICHSMRTGTHTLPLSESAIKAQPQIATNSNANPTNIPGTGLGTAANGFYDRVNGR